MHYCSLLHEEQSRTRVQHKLQQQQNTNVLWLHLLLPLLLRLWWRRLRFLLTEVWREEDEGKKKPTTAATASKGRRQLFVLRGSKHFAEALIAFLSLGFRKFHKSSSLTIEELQCSLASSSYGGHSNRSSKVQKNESNFLMMKAQSSIITLTRLKSTVLTGAAKQLVVVVKPLFVYFSCMYISVCLNCYCFCGLVNLSRWH